MSTHDLYARAASELLRALRGKHSQVALARRLGYRGNPITDWEHGRRYPTAPEALRLAARLRRDLPAAFARFSPAEPPSARARWSVAGWLDGLRGSTTTVELARRSQRSRFSVGRWLSGESVPRLPDFLRLLDACTGRAAEWVAALVPIEEVPSLEATYRRASAARRISMELPWSEAVLRVMETVAYTALPRHSTAFISAVLGTSAAEVDEVIHTLLEARVLEQHVESYRVSGTLLVDTRADPESVRRSREHWAKVALSRLGEQHGAWFAYNVISVSEKDCARIEQRLRAAYREVRGIVQASEPCETAALLTLQLVRWLPPNVAGTSRARTQSPEDS